MRTLWNWLFGRRRTWAHYHAATDGRLRFTLYGDADPEQVESAWRWCKDFCAEHDGWAIVAAPKE